MKQDICKKLIDDLGRSIRKSINEAFDFGSVSTTKTAGERVTDQARKVVQEENITNFLNGFLKELNGSDNIEIVRESMGWHGHSSKNSWNNLDVIVIPHDHVNVEVQINGFQIIHKTFILALNFAKKNNIVINKIVFEEVANRKHNFFSFSIADILTWNDYSLPDQIIFKSKEGEEKEAICVIQQTQKPIELTEDSLDILEYINEHFVDIIFLGFEGASQTFINENVYQLGIDNPQAYLKSKKLKCEAKDLQRVEDLLKKGKSCESMAKAIGEKNMSKAGSRFVASLRLLNLPVPPFDDDAEAEQEIMRYYSDFFNSVSTNNPEVHKSLNKIKTLCPGYFAKKFLELGGTMEDIFAMYDASYGDEANPDTITARQQKINSFSKATTEKYGRLKDFVVFLDSLNIPYSVDPIDKRTTSGWGGSKQEWQGVTLFDDDDPNTAHFAITSSEGMVRGNGDRVGSYRVDGGGWTRYGYRSRYKAEYAQNGNWRMEGDLEVIHISDNLKPFLKEGPINLTQVRNAIKKFLKSIGK